ncbi:MAG: hypothetical protein AAFZ87_08975, partial [Planctomycetota bacterium]
PGASPGPALERVVARAPVDRPRVPGASGVFVSVVARDGEPVCGVPVLGDHSTDAPPTLGDSIWRDAPRTDEDGRALVPESERYCAGALGRVVATSTDAEPTTIVLPPHGALEVDFGEHAEGGTLHVRAGREREVHAFAAGEILRVPVVPLGEELVLSATGPTAYVSEPLQGPAAEGEVVTWAPRVDPFVTVAARFVDAEGVPLAGHTVRFPEVPGRRRTAEPLELDADGAAEVRMRSRAWEPYAGSSFEFRTKVPPKTPRNDALVGSGFAPIWSGDARIDLGTVTLRELPLLVAGRVLGPDGRARPGARVSVEQQRTSKSDGARSSGAVRYESVAGTSVKTGPDGRFEIRAPTADFAAGGAPLRLEARPVDFAAMPSLRAVDEFPFHARQTLRVDVEVGRTDLELRFETPGSIEVDVAHVPPVLRIELAFRLVPEDSGTWLAPTGVEAWSPGCVRMEGEATVRDFVLPGSYTLEVRWAGCVVRRLEGIQVPSGGACTDPRLAPLDLGVETRSARVVSVSGEAIGAPVLIRRGWNDVWQPIDGSWARRIAAQGLPSPEDAELCWLALPTDAVRLAVTAPGHGAVEIAGAADGARIALPELVPVTLTFEADEEEVDALQDGKIERFRVAAADPDVPFAPRRVRSLTRIDGRHAEATVHVPPGVECVLRTRFAGWEEEVTWTAPGGGDGAGTVTVRRP